jgi:RNA polymerase sigma-70 factor (ECF subfamily)
MKSDSGADTSPTLLGKLRQDPTDQAAWERFVDHYGPQIYDWCRKWHLQDADAQDVTQNVLVKLAAKMRSFTYDPARSFRAWLKTITQHAWSDYVAGRQRPGAGTGDTQVLAKLETIEAREDLMKRLDEAFDRELLEQAMARVRLRVAPHTWDAFRLTALEGLSGAAAAEQLGLKVANVFVAKSEVQKMLAEEVRRLEEPPPTG